MLKPFPKEVPDFQSAYHARAGESFFVMPRACHILPVAEITNIIAKRLA